jgi:hypothetical protein
MQLNGMPELQARLESGTVNQSAAALRDERIALKAELAAAQARLDAVHASTSWRVTAPLRAMLDVIQRRAR